MISGGAGCGKTIFGMSFLVHGAMQFDEPGVFMSFEERPVDLVENVRSLGYDLDELMESGKLAIDHVVANRSDFEESGEYDLEGLFVRLEFALRAVNAKRLVIDTIETLFAIFTNEVIMRSELVRLFTWIKDRGITTIITGERGEGTLTRHGLEEYVSDCVILLDNRVQDEVTTRRLRIVKFRGSTHGLNEYPFLVDQEGFTVVPITSVGLAHKVSSERVSSGIPRLDAMLGGDGYYRGSSVLVTGTAGTGKTSIAASFADAACQRGERVLYFAFEESPAQIVRNAQSIGIDLKPWLEKGLLHIESARPQVTGLESHLVRIYRLIDQFNPATVVVDPVSNLVKAGTTEQASSMLYRLLDHLKVKGVTGLYTALTGQRSDAEQTDFGMSSLMDTWLLLRDIESAGERNRGIYVLKARGTAHSNQIREFRITSSGLEILDVFLGPEGVVTGSARLAREADHEAQRVERELERARHHAELERLHKRFEAQVAQLQAEYETAADEVHRRLSEATGREEQIARDREAMGVIRQADDTAGNGRGNRGSADRHEQESRR